MHTAITGATEAFEKALNYLSKEYAGLQIGRASAGLVEGIEVDAYGALQPIKNMAQIAIPDARSITITPWDAGLLPNVEKAINDSNLGIMPNNDGHAIYINLPPMTEERRKETVKVVHKLAEEAKIAIRNARHDAMDSIKKDELSEDEEKMAEKELQDKVDEYNKNVEEHMKKKETEVMTV